MRMKAKMKQGKKLLWRDVPILFDGGKIDTTNLVEEIVNCVHVLM